MDDDLGAVGGFGDFLGGLLRTATDSYVAIKEADALKNSRYDSGQLSQGNDAGVDKRLLLIGGIALIGLLLVSK